MIRALLSAQVAAALERLPREPHLHAKQALAVQLREDAEALDALGGPTEPVAGDLGPALAARIARMDPIADGAELETLLLLQRRVQRRRAPGLVLYETDAVPARDPWIEPGRGSHPVNDALVIAEAAATTALETPWATRRRLIGVIAHQLERTAEHEWELETVDTSRYAELLALPLGDRVEQLLREGGGSDEDAAV